MRGRIVLAVSLAVTVLLLAGVVVFHQSAVDLRNARVADRVVGSAGVHR